MVKNIPTIERSTKIRFGKNALDDQGENTIVLNASNTAINASSGGSLYISPVRRDTEYNGKAEVVLMMYNVETKELVESGESAQDLIGNQGFQAVTNQGNVTSNVVRFFNDTTAFVTQSNVGIANSTPGHTLSIGSNVYFNDAGSNVLVVSGGVSIDGNLDVNGGITTITSNNLIIEDAIIELGKNNTSGDTTLDLGLIMGRPGSNVTVGFREETDEIILAFTESSAHNNAIVPLTSEDINVHVYGRLYTESNVGVLNTNPMHTLDVGSNLYVDEFGSNILVVTGNTSVSGDLTVDTDTLFVDSSENKVGIKTVTPSAELHVVGNVYVSSNLSVDEDTFHIDVVNDSIGVGTVNPKANLHVIGNVYVTSNLSVDEDTFHIDVVNDSIGVGTVNPKANLHVIGNVYVTSNLTVDTNTLHVDTEADHIGINTVTPSAELHVVGNVFVTSNVSIADTTATSSKTTGALKVAGGVGVSGALFGSTAEFDGITKVTNNTTSGAKNAGALIVTGGVGIGENLFVGGTGKIENDTDASSTTSGALQVLGGLGVVKSIHAADTTFESVNITDNTNSTDKDTGALIVQSGGAGIELNLNVGGVTKVWDGTNASSTTTGALQVVGGLGVAKTIFAADMSSGSVIVTDNTTSTSATTGALKVVGGISTQENLHIGGVSKVYGTTASDGKTAGALIVAGGVGVSGALFGSTAEFDGITKVTNNTTSGAKNAGALIVTGGVGITGPLFGSTATLDGVVNLTDDTTSTSATTGALKVVGGISTQENLHIGGVSKVYGTTASDGKTAGALIVAGGVGVSGALFGAAATLDGVVTLTDDTTSTSATTGALKVAGGISTQENLNVGGDLKVDTSVLVVNSTTNRVGINKATPGYTLDVDGDINFTGTFREDGNPFVSTPWTIETSPDALNYTAGNVGIGATDPAAKLTVTGDAQITTTLSVGGVVTLTDATTSTSVTTGALKVAGGISTEEKLNVGGITKVWDGTNATDTTTGALKVVGGLGVAKTIFAADLSSGSVIVTDDTTSTSATTGALKVTGGVSTQENLNVGGVTKVWDGTNATDTTTGALKVVGGLGVAKTIFAADMSSGSVIVSDGTTSTTTTSGALKVAGGVGIVENLNVGGDLKVDTSILVVNSTTDRVGINKAVPAYTLDVDGDINFTGTLRDGGNPFGSSPWEIESSPTALSYEKGNVGIGDANPAANLHVTGNVYVSANLEVGASALYVDTVSATSNVGIGTSKPAYSLDVVGDINFSGDLYEGGNPFVGSPWNPETNPVAINYVAGSVGIGAINPAAKLAVTGDALITTTLNVGGVVTLTDATEATSSTTGALKAAGGVGIAKDVYVGERAYVTGGLITNTGQVTKKTYSFTGALTSGQTIADSTIKITFSAHVFYAKIVAHLIEDDDEVSTLSMECGGGHRTGGTPLVIAKGPISVFGNTSTNPWNSTVAVTTTTVALAPTTNMAAVGNYNIFIEYISAHASGAVTNIIEGSTTQITFGY